MNHDHPFIFEHPERDVTGRNSPNINLSEWEPHKNFIIECRNSNPRKSRKEILGLLKEQRNFNATLHSFAYFLWKSGLSRKNISNAQYEYILVTRRQRELEGGPEVAFKFKDSGKRISEEKIQRAKIRYAKKQGRLPIRNRDGASLNIIAYTPLAGDTINLESEIESSSDSEEVGTDLLDEDSVSEFLNLDEEAM